VASRAGQRPAIVVALLYQALSACHPIRHRDLLVLRLSSPRASVFLYSCAARAAPASLGREQRIPRIELNDPVLRRRLRLVLSGVFLLIVLLAVVATSVLVHQSSPSAAVCHTVMEREHTAYLAFPSTRRLRRCHVALARLYVKSKLSASGRCRVLSDRYSRPIASQSRTSGSGETCEECHWPQKFTAPALQIRIPSETARATRSACS